MEPQKRRRFSYAWTAAAWVALIALLAGGGLFALRLWHGRAVHQAAALSVGERGQWLAMSLALRAAAAAEAGQAEAWRDFSGLLRSMREVESDLEYVAVRRNGVTLFQEHAETLGAATDPGDLHFDGPVAIGRQLLATGAGAVPVVTFSVAVTNPRTESVALELGLRRGAVEWEEWPARRAIDSFYRLSLATLAVCFGVCLALVAGMVRREERRERARRQEEHLAFSGVLANGIVHDFRNPMSSLRLDAQMLEKEAARGAESRPARIAELAGRMRHTLDRMEKVFQEFLALARPAAAVAVEVARAGGQARLDVRDTGPGIPKAERERIFEMFYTTRPQGTGLGLFLARTAIEQNGGLLAVVEPTGPGACFRLEFPLAEKEPT